MLGALGQFGQSDGAQGDSRGTLWGFYAQDDWHVRRDLTVNLGMRRDPHLPYHEATGRQSCRRPGQKSQVFANAPAGWLFAGDSGCSAAGTDPQLSTVQPRVGVAWNIGGRNTWVVHSGYGIYYQPLGTFFNTEDLLTAPSAGTPPNSSLATIPGGNRSRRRGPALFAAVPRPTYSPPARSRSSACLPTAS